MEQINPKDLANRDAIRQHTVRGIEQVKVKFENITPRPGFNERIDFGDIPALAQSILDDGLLFAIWVDMLADGTCLLVDGERRFKAIAWLRSQGHEYDLVPAIIAPKGWNDVDRLFFMAQANNGGKPFDDMELGRVFVRLVNMGITQAEISRRMGNMSEMVVGNRIVAAKLTDREKDSVNAGEISLTAAVAFAKRESNPAVRQAKIKEAAVSGKTLKVKDVLPPAVTGGADPVKSEDSIPSLSKNKAWDIITECLNVIKTMNSFLEPGNVGGEYTLKLENKLRELKGLLS